jgi:medium-chain acyl-[acyl-carrier-protein] hydrolase
MTNAIPSAAGRPWWLVPRPLPNAVLRLYCIPHAGAGASAYTSWAAQLPDGVELRAVQLPGRETRYSESPLESVLAAAVSLAARIAADATPCALFGHSLGALIAFEVARTLGAEVVALFVSAAPAPSRPRALPRGVVPPVDLPASAAREVLEQLGGTDRALLRSDMMVQSIWRTLRADLQMFADYQYVPATRLALPIFVYGGSSDTIPTSDLDAWRTETVSSARLQLFGGGHFYTKTCERELLDTLSTELRYLAARIGMESRHAPPNARVALPSTEGHS